MNKTVCPNCRKELDIPTQKEKIQCNKCGEIFKPEHSTKDLTPSRVMEQEGNKFTQLFKIEKEEIQGKEFGRYRIVDEIGSGGMGKVYKAYDSELERMVALKLMLSGENAKKTEVQRFLREARATARLQHSNIVTVLDIGQQEGQYFFAMELIEGVSLKELLGSTSMSVRRKISIFKKIAQAVDYAHKEGVIHRDLKPANVMMDKNKNPKVMDFGLAKVRKAKQKLSKSGMVIGTLQYMPPEQAEGKIREVDERSDIYSLGAIFYEMLTNTAPFTGDTTSNILYQVLNKEPLSPSKLKKRLPKDLDTICLKALEKKKERRYQSISAFIQDLTLFEQGKGVKTKSFQWNRVIRQYRTTLICFSMILFFFFTFYMGGQWSRQVNQPFPNQPPKILPKKETQSSETQEKASVVAERKIEGFKYIGTNKYSSGGVENEVKEFRHTQTGIEFVLVPGGSFMMGSNDGNSDEKPMHRVNVPEFLISKHEVTQGQWQKIMGTNPWTEKNYVKKGANYAASYVSWNDANEFCQKTELRLPSESEWEYACGAGTTGKYYWNNAMIGDYAWYRINAWDVGEKYAHEVGSKKSNAFGLYDMSGNVWEWCEDRYQDSYSGAPGNGSAWTDNEGSKRVFRGGGLDSYASILWTKNRGGDLPRNGYYYLGFRLCFSPLSGVKIVTKH